MTSRDHWFEELADHLGTAYLRYSFTYGTEQEVDFLVEQLGLTPGTRVLDVGCGPGRHAKALARRGMVVHGIDISQRFVDLAAQDAPPGATFERLDARTMPFAGEFDLVLSLCQGAFGLPAQPGGDPAVDRASGAAFGLPAQPGGERAVDRASGAAFGLPPVAAAQPGGDPAVDRAGTDPDRRILERMVAACRPGGRVVLSAFSAYFQVRHLDETGSFDAASGVNHERTEIRDPEGRAVEVDLWTTCFTPRELRLLAQSVGLRPDAVWSVTPGGYAARRPDLDHEEFLLVASKA